MAIARFWIFVVMMVLVGWSGQDHRLFNDDGLGPVAVYCADGMITDGELEGAWRLAEECMVDRGNDAILEEGRMGVLGP